MIDTANGMCDKIVALLHEHCEEVTVVNSVVTVDSVVEHVIDIDFVYGDMDWNMSINMNRIGLKKNRPD